MSEDLARLSEREDTPSIESRITKLEEAVNTICQRNNRVEAEKAWELSWTRNLAILFLTYLLTCVVFYLIGVRNFLLNALIPTLGYYLSTRSLPLLKKRWLAKKFSAREQVDE